jgi:hypothetical protein
MSLNSLARRNHTTRIVLAIVTTVILVLLGVRLLRRTS